MAPFWPRPPKLIYRIVLKTSIPDCCSRCPKKLVKVLGKMFGITKVNIVGGGFVVVEGPVEGRIIQRLLNDKLCKNVYMVESELIYRTFRPTSQSGGGVTNKPSITPETPMTQRTSAPPRWSDTSAEARRKGKQHVVADREQGSARGQAGIVIREPAVLGRSSSSRGGRRPRFEAGEGSIYGCDDNSSAGGYWTPQYEPHEEIHNNNNRNNTHYNGDQGYKYDNYSSGGGGFGNNGSQSYHQRSGDHGHNEWWQHNDATSPPQYTTPPPEPHRSDPAHYFNDANVESTCTIT